MANPAFDLFFAVLVAINTIFMGVDVELSLAGLEPLAIAVIRRSFTAVFAVTWPGPIYLVDVTSLKHVFLTRN